MLLKSYQTKFVRPLNPSAQNLSCFAHLQADISQVLPYLNTVLKGHEFSREPPSLTIKYPGKLITLTSREIAINIVKDQDEAGEILAWLQGEINAAWERRAEIVPSFEVAALPRVLNILKLLPRSNCGACGPPAWFLRFRWGRGRKARGTAPILPRKTVRGCRSISGRFSWLINALELIGGVL
jgi:ArsR family metal-binding transcriptional regulator